MLLTNLALATCLQVAAVPPQSTPQAPDHDLVVVHVADQRMLDRVLALDLDIASCGALELPVREVEIIADAADIAKLKRAGLTFRIAVRNIEDATERRLSKFVFPNTLTPPVGQGAMGGHYTLAQIVAHLDKFAKDHPSICAKKVSLGKSIQGRDIWMVKISDNVNKDEPEPEVLYDALHHAREPLSATTTLFYMDWLLSNYGKDAVATRIVNTRELYFVPCVNPDGYEYNRSIRPGGGGMWRKNRRANGGGSYGVDLNRNWPTGWSAPNGGNSTNPNSSTYRGTKPLSEPEVLALDTFIKSRKFVLGNSAHTYTEILLRPWGYKRSEPANVAEYRRIDAAALAKNPMRSGAASTALYIAAGTALDHYHTHGMYGYTPELGLSSEGGFWPSPPNQVRIAKRHLHMFKVFSLVAGSTITVGDTSLTEAAGGNSNGRVDPGERGEVRIELRNDGASATTTRTVAGIKSLTAGITVIKSSHDYGKVPKFSTANNNAAPLLLNVASAFKGLVARIEITITYDGIIDRQTVDLPLVKPATIVGTAFEKDLGFRRSTTDTARTGRFERAAPQRTTYQGRDYQPGADHSATGTKCWVTGAAAGSSVGANDVDNGRTSFESPDLDLRHVAKAGVSAWVYFSESGSPPDPFRVEASANGGQTWTEIHSLKASTPGWQRISIDLSGPMTDRMRVRFRAEDIIQQSLVEALVDDFAVTGIVEPGATTILAGAQRGTAARIALRGTPGGVSLPMFSTTTGQLTIPGIGGKLLLGFGGLVLLPPVSYASTSIAAVDVAIPNDTAFSGLRLYWQQLFVNGSTAQLGNATSFRIQ